MKRVLTATSLALACAVALSAQTPPDKPQTPKPTKPTTAPAEPGQKDRSQKPAIPAEKGTKPASTVTLTGCLRAGEGPNAFVLANWKESAATGKTEPALTPTAPAPPPDRPAVPPTPPQPQTYPGNPPATPTTPPTAPNPPSNPEAGAPAGTSGMIQTAGQTVRLIGVPAALNLKAHVGHTVRITGSWAPQAKGKPTEGAAATGRSFNVKSMEHVSEKCDVAG